jgi:hypothetical protein
MKKLFLMPLLLLTVLTVQAQLSKSEVEGMIKSVNMQELKDVYVVRTRQHDGAAGWFERFEKLDAKTLKISYGETSMTIEGTTYMALLPYEKIKIIFYKRATHLTIEMQD